MAQTVQTAVETLYGSSDFAVFFDDTLINDLVINFSTNGYVNGIASSATINCIYSEAFYKIKNYDKDGNLVKEMHGIDYMTNVKIFIKNTINNLYYMVFDGNLTGKNLTKSNEGQVSLTFSAEDYMHYLDKTVVPISVPLTFGSSDRVKWKSQGINLEVVSRYQNESKRSLKDMNIKELIDECIKVSISNNAFFSDKEGVTYWDAPTDRLKVMGDISERLRAAKIIDYIVTSDGTSVSSMYVLIGSLANSLMFEFYQDRDGIIRIKPPFWNEGVLKDHIIMPSFVSSYEETTDFTKMYTRVVTQGSMDPSISVSGGGKNYFMPVGCYVAGDENQDGVWVSYTSGVDPYTEQDRVARSLLDFIDTTTNAAMGSVYGTSGTPTGTGAKAWNTATEAFRPLVTKVATKWGMAPVVNILLAMIMQESSGGTGTSGSGLPASIDVMQANEGAYGERYSGNVFNTPEDSINAGVQEFKDSLTKANGDVAIALQAYNFGPRYLTYVKENGGVHTTAIAYAFSEMMQEKFSDDFPNGYGDPLYVSHVMQYVPAGSPTNYMPSTGTASGSTVDSVFGAIPNIAAITKAALSLNYISSSIFYNSVQRSNDLSGRQAFSLPGFGSSSSGLLGRTSAFTTGNSAFNPLLWSLDSDIVDFLNKTKAGLGGTMAAGIIGGNNGTGVTVTGKCVGSATVTENIYNIGKSNLDSRQWGGIKATAGCYIDARQFSTVDLLAVGRQYFDCWYNLVGANASPERGYDCASYVASVYSHFGIRLGTYVRAINDPGHGELGGMSVKPVAFESLAVGDLLVWPGNKHITMYAGNGRMYAAPTFGKKVQEQSMTKADFNRKGIVAIRRPAIFRDSPGAGSYTNVGTTASVPAATVPVATVPVGSVPMPSTPIYSGAMKSIEEQNHDLATGKTSISGVSPNSGFLGDTELSPEGTVVTTTKESMVAGKPYFHDSPYLATAVKASNNSDTQEGSLLWQSNRERKYGANILNVDQPLIRGYDKFMLIETADGPAGSISDALRSYSIFMHGLTNGLVETATLTTTAPMPWLRCGMNCWVDPMGIDKIFYINGIKHSGSAKGGVYTELSLGYGRSRYQYLNETSKFGSLRNSWKDNVFVSKIYQEFSVEAFGRILDTKEEFASFKGAIERNYEIAGKESFAFTEPKSIDNTKIYRDLYGGQSMDTSGRDGLDIGVLNPNGEILLRTATGSIITATEAERIYKESKAAAGSTQAPTTPSDPPSGYFSGDIAKWANGTDYPSGVTYEDKKCLKYLSWLETMPSLRYGDNGDQVKRLQRILYYLGIVIMDANGIDGYFGPITRRGVQAVQNTFDMSQTGVLTSKEIDKLKDLLKNLLSSVAKSAYVSAISSSPSTSASGQPVLDNLTIKESPLTGPVYQKSSDVYDYTKWVKDKSGKDTNVKEMGRSTKRMLLGAYSLTVIQDTLEVNYNRANAIVRDRSYNVRKTFQRAMNEIATRSPMMKFKPN